MITYPRYEFINVLYDDGYLCYVLKIDVDSFSGMEEFISHQMSFSPEDAITNLSETLRFNRKNMTSEEFNKYCEGLE